MRESWPGYAHIIGRTMTEDAAPSPASEPSPRPPSAWRSPWLYVAIATFALAAWQWGETRSKLADTQQEVARRLNEAASAGKEDRGALRLAQEQTAALQAKVGALEARQAEFQGQSAALQNLYQELSRSRDEATLLEVEQAVNLAAQQLQLTGNVATAVLALQSAEARLARLDRPQFIPLRKALGHDLERLRALPLVDLAGISLKIENIVLSIDKLPLAVDERPAPAENTRQAGSSQPSPAAPPWWQRAGEELWRELRSLVRIQRFDRDEPVLLAPGQTFFLRENLKLRLLNARLALLSRDAWTFRNEIKVALDWLGRHFDPQEKSVQNAQNSLKQLAASEINIELPNLNESLAALRPLKPAKDKK